MAISMTPINLPMTQMCYSDECRPSLAALRKSKLGLIFTRKIVTLSWFLLRPRGNVKTFKYSVSQKIPLRFSDISPNGWEFLINFTHLLCVSFYIRLQIFYSIIFNFDEVMSYILSATTWRIFFTFH